MEKELKLALTEAEYDKLCALTKNLPQPQTNFYFAEAGKPINTETMVRIREKGGKYLLCFKRRVSDKNDISVCDERECALASAFAAKALQNGLDAEEVNGLLGTNLCGKLVCLGKSETYRTTFWLKSWRLELDKSLYLGVCDYELECECDDSAALEELKTELAENLGIKIRRSRPKFARFLEVFNKKGSD